MSSQECNVIRISLTKDESGLFVATSPDLSGVCVAHRNIWSIHDDFPNVIRLWFKRHHDQDVEVFNGNLPDSMVDEEELETVNWKTVVIPSQSASASFA